MNESNERPVTEIPCGITSLIPLGMSCRGRAEAFARSLQTKLRTLGTQGTNTVSNNQSSDPENHTENTWLTQAEQEITNLQPARHLANESDSYFDFDIDPTESPGSPIDECEYSRLIDSTSITPLADNDNYDENGTTESGYICASPISSPTGSADSHSSSDVQFFDPDNSETEQRSLSLSVDFYDCIDGSKKESALTAVNSSPTVLLNGRLCNRKHISSTITDSDSGSDSFPQSQSTTTTLSSPFTAPSSTSNSTLQDVDALVNIELQADSCIPLQHHTDETFTQQNGIDMVDRCECDSGDNGINGSTDEVLESNEQIQIGLLLDCLSHDDPEHAIVNDDVIECNGIESNVPLIENNDSSEKALNVEDGEDDERPQRVRRCTSLKTGKTPPGTPGRKKIVRFADALGLDLADVRTFLDEIPKIPRSAFEDLEICYPIEQSVSLGPRPDKILVPLFQQPSGLPGFLDLVRQKQVCLENAAVTDPATLTITGSVRVRNLDFHKSVHLRYTLDAWRSYADLQANYVDKSCDGFSDKFTFILFGNSLQIGQRMEVAIRFSCQGEQYWDNNFGLNYCFQCLPATIGSQHRCASEPQINDTILPNSAALGHVDSWCGSFY